MAESPDRSVPALRRLAWGLLFDHHEAEDVVQEAWLAALGTGRRAPRHPAWLSETVRRLALNRRRSRLRRRAREETAARAEALPGADERAERLEVLRRLLDALERLDEPYRSAVMLRYLDDLPPREVARHLGLKVNTARTHVRRGLERLRRDLDGEHGRGRQELLAALAPLAREIPPGVSGGIVPAGVTLAAVLLAGLGAWSVLRWVLREEAALPPAGVEVAALREPEPAADPAEPARHGNLREPAATGFAAMEASWVVRGHAFRGQTEPFPGLALVGRVYAGPASEGVPLIEERFVADEAGDFAWEIPPPTDLVFVLVEPEIPGHVTARHGSVFLPGDAPPERWVVRASLLDTEILGTVRDLQDRPIAGVVVRSIQDQETITDGAGCFRISAASGDDTSEFFWLFTRAAGFAAARIEVLPWGGEIELPDLILRPEWVLRGRVVDEAGAAVAEARIRLESEPDLMTTSGEDGSFQLGGFDDHDTLWIHVSKDGYAEASQDILPAARGSEIEVRLQHGIRVAGHVVTGNGDSPVWGARVSIGAFLGDPIEAVVNGSSALTDRDGCFVLENVPPGRQRFWIERTGYPLTRVSQRIPDDIATFEVEFVLDAEEHFLGGLVLDSLGQPAPWTRIDVYDRELFAPLASTLSWADGRFRVAGLPDRRMKVSVFAGGLVRARQVVPELDRDDLVLQLEPTSSLAGRVLDADTGAPVRSFSVRGPGSDLEVGNAVLHFGIQRSFANPDGSWALEIPGDPGLAFSLEIEAEGYVTNRVDLARSAIDPSPDELVIRLVRSTLVRGWVVAMESGLPLEGVRLRRVTAGQQLEYATDLPETTSDERGWFELTGVPTGEMLLAVEAPQRALLVDGPFVVGSTPLERRIELGIGATVRGTLVDPDGSNLGGETVTLEAWDGFQENKEWRATTDSEGRFVFSGLMPGACGLTWDRYQGGEWVLRMTQGIEIGEEDLEILLQPRGRALVSGTLAYDGELPASDSVWVRPVSPDPPDPERALWARSSLAVPTHGRRFEVRLEPGEYEISFEHEEDLRDLDPEDPFEQGGETVYGETRVVVPEEGTIEVRLMLERRIF